MSKLMFEGLDLLINRKFLECFRGKCVNKELCETSNFLFAWRYLLSLLV
jgi:hypothetical protein